MATLFKEDGSWKVQYRDGKSRPKIIIGRMAKAQATSIKLRVEHLVAAKVAGLPIDSETAHWLATISDDLAEKLAERGLCQPRPNGMLIPFVEALIAKKTTWRPGTVVVARQTRDRLAKHFGTQRSLLSVTPADADDFAAWLRTQYAQATASRTIKRCKEFFRRAVREKLLAENPFEDVAAGTMANPARHVFVTHADTRKVIEAAPNAQWRAVIALARFGGLRIPSEILPLTWGDIVWDQNRFRVTSPKTARHAGKGERWVPIFPELKPYLDELYELAADGQVSVFTSFRPGENLHTVFARLIRKAGLSAWERPFQNLRSSRETELMDVFPSHLVTAWLGNSRIIAERHYLQVRDSDFDRAASIPTQTAGAKSGALPEQNPERTGIPFMGRDWTKYAEILPGDSVSPMASNSVQPSPNGSIVPA